MSPREATLVELFTEIVEKTIASSAAMMSPENKSRQTAIRMTLFIDVMTRLEVQEIASPELLNVVLAKVADGLALPNERLRLALAYLRSQPKTDEPIVRHLED